MTSLPADLRRLAESLRIAPQRPILGLDPGVEQTPLGRRLAVIAGSLRNASGDRVSVLHNPSGEVLAPGLTLQVAGRTTVRYLALPEGPEAAPFAEALSTLAGLNEARLPSVSGLEGVKAPAHLMIFIAPACPHCPNAVRSALAIALEQPAISVTVIDASELTEIAQRFRVQSVPTTIIDGELSLTGVVPPQQLTHQLLNRGSDEHLKQTLLSMIGSGRIEQATAHLVTHPGAGHALAAAWIDSTLETRLGLMLVAETTLKNHPTALDDAVEQLLPGLESKLMALRGDTADLLGRIAHCTALEPLRLLLADPDPDVAEAAAEAIEHILTRRA